ncbi:putative transcription regulator [Scheffersomyces coipomensis]|uniref:putative transcription regulator n=1 Tax=Scheffersomyces coipomensis TaxID=1788519 RepID=UPI00315DFD80
MPLFTKGTMKFTDWLNHHDITISSKVLIADLRNSEQGRGVIALDDINKGEVLFSIPRDSILNVGNCSLIEDYPDIKQKLVHLTHWESLIIVLLYEVLVKGENSKWNDYLDVLPVKSAQFNAKQHEETFNQLMYWNSDELHLLEPSLILERVGKDLAVSIYNKLYPGIIIEELGIKELEGKVTLDMYLAIASTIMSYSFDVEISDFDEQEENEEEEEVEDEEEEELEEEEDDEEKEEGEDNESKTQSGMEPRSILMDGYYKSMVPLADTLNADTNLHNASLTYVDNELVMKSLKAIKKGDQIYNTYSDHPNSEILRRYGYVETQGSKYDFGEIPLNLITKHFEDTTGLTEESIKDLLHFVNQIIMEEHEDDENLVDIVLDSYDCFKSGDVILELIFLIQILTIIAAVDKTESIMTLEEAPKYQLINRISKKCYQLIESKKLTNQFLENYKAILNSRLNQYPKLASQPYEPKIPFTRSKMAEVVLKSEYQSLKNCLDIDKTFKKNEDLGPFKFIDDEKLIRNIIKKRAQEDSSGEETSSIKKSKTT